MVQETSELNTDISEVVGTCKQTTVGQPHPFHLPPNPVEASGVSGGHLEHTSCVGDIGGVVGVDGDLGD